MYEEFFDLSTRPFSTATDPEAFVPVGAFQEVLDTLIHTISQARGIAVVTADPGLGKTMLCKRLSASLHGECISVHLNASSLQTRRALLQGILYELEISYTGLTEQESRLKLFDAARRAGQEQQFLLITVDDAHALPTRLFEELRTLTEYAPEGVPLIRLVLFGQFALEEKLADPALAAVQQRIGSQSCLTPLNLEQSAEFIVERLRRADGKDLTSLLAEEALEAICRASDGNPRCLCQLADHSFLLAFAAECKPIDRQTVLAALDDLKELPLHWNDVREEHDDFPVATAEQQPQQLPDEDDHRFLSEDWDSQHLLDDTAEFEIPDFLRRRETTDSSSHESAASRNSAAADALVEYSVMEVGQGVDDDRDLEIPDAPCRPRIASFSDASLTKMIETEVRDHYAYLDRLAELPEEFHGEFVWSLPPLNEVSPEIAQSEHPGMSDPDLPAATPVDTDLESQLLGDIADLRREIGDAVEDARTVYEFSSAWEGDEFPYDIVQPGPPIDLHMDAPTTTSSASTGNDERFEEIASTDPLYLTDEGDPSGDELPPPLTESESGLADTTEPESDEVPPNAVMETPYSEPSHSQILPESRLPQEPPPSTRRFELLFTRLRQRRQRIRSEQH